jgi:hypothetical protein
MIEIPCVQTHSDAMHRMWLDHFANEALKAQNDNLRLWEALNALLAEVRELRTFYSLATSEAEIRATSLLERIHG